ncbi:electron transporter SenC [Halomonas cupida]|uniref:Electron transporter SenC n=1 Tax=Halomonas cupida TaxID=44933 RepID=A0A1M7L1I0_9GAMM|nr:SCO family protein [Halomonas cupida]GEN26324.1 electron transporter SenC [Halomonas cupida]SHM71342.1 protein SCO1/2 [Halomonas cupida]
MTGRKVGMSLAVVGILATALLLSWKPWQAANEEGLVGGPIELPATTGTFSLSDLGDDQIAVVFFGFTWCPDVCPMALSVIRQARQALPEDQRQRVVPVLISVDPERDSVERLKEYLAFFGDDFIGATGSKAQLEDVGKRYNVKWRRQESQDSALGYTMDHSASLYLVDAEGRVMQRVLHSPTPGPLQAALEKVLGG